MDLTITLLVAAIACIALTVGGVLLLPWLRDKRQGYPYESQLEALCLPLVYQAILGAYKASEYALKSTGNRLEGVDKATLAKAAYGLLPAAIVIRGVAIPVKAMVSEQQFTIWIVERFDDFLRFYAANCVSYEAAVDQWAAGNKPA
jgi:hypothetical protein